MNQFGRYNGGLPNIKGELRGKGLKEHGYFHDPVDHLAVENEFIAEPMVNYETTKAYESYKYGFEGL